MPETASTRTEAPGQPIWVSQLLRPYIYFELPLWGKVADTLQLFAPNDPRWRGVRRFMRGKVHGYEIDLDLGLHEERKVFFLGRFYDRPMQDLMKMLLREGDRFIDIGANVGEVTLLAARLVGSSGRVDAVEPIPSRCERLRARVVFNGISQVVVHPYAMSHEESTAKLWVHEATVMGTLGQPAEDDDHVYQEIEVPVKRADDVLLESEKPARMIKVDVEGFEQSVLRGMETLVERDRPAVIITETIPSLLERAGSSVLEMFQWMEPRGYAAFTPELVRRGLAHELRVTRIDEPAPPHRGPDIWWARRESDAYRLMQDRLR